MIAAWRQPAIESVTDFRSGVMKRPLKGSPSMAVFAAMSAARHCRSSSRSVSVPGQSGDGSVAPCLSGGIILLSSPLESLAGRILHCLLGFPQNMEDPHEL